MPKYFFILGSHQVLSLAEIFSYFRKKQLEIKLLHLKKGVLIIESDKKIDLEKLNKKLGGIVKSGPIKIEEEKGHDLSETLKNIFNPENILNNFVSKTDKKIYVGFSLYVQKNKIFNQTKAQIKDLLISAKNKFKEREIKSRVVSSRSRRLSSVVVKKNKLLSQGSEINIFIFGSKIMLGRTETVQDFEDYSFRDYKRPARDMDIGMMPPKLARMMINISGGDKNDVLLDPFCGCGTILQEALLLGFAEVIGSDVSAKAISKTKKNIKWLENKYNLENRKVRIFKLDISYLGKNLKSNLIDLVITEPYLGPVLKNKLNQKETRKITDQLINLYRNFFKEIKKVLRKRGKIVIIWPVFKTYKGFQNLPILEEVIKMGFRQEKILPDELKNKSFSEITRRGSVIYSRQGQNILREIFVFNNQ
ncbi:MAG: methyltransferase domain-containing protein [Patescibacteria group bacterium]|nr:methyltransferase domain-containing protein [Patescibacteria group bacterium]